MNCIPRHRASRQGHSLSFHAISETPTWGRPAVHVVGMAQQTSLWIFSGQVSMQSYWKPAGWLTSVSCLEVFLLIDFRRSQLSDQVSSFGSLMGPSGICAWTRKKPYLQEWNKRRKQGRTQHGSRRFFQGKIGICHGVFLFRLLLVITSVCDVQWLKPSARNVRRQRAVFSFVGTKMAAELLLWGHTCVGSYSKFTKQNRQTAAFAGGRIEVPPRGSLY